MKISFDLDEVLFVNPEKIETEPPLRFPMNRLFPERLRKGTPELIHSLQQDGFEVWVYTSSFRTETYIRNLFRRYGVRFDGIVNGDRHQAEVQKNHTQAMPTKDPAHFRIALHVDDEESVIQNASLHGFRAIQVYGPDPDWAEKVRKEAFRVRKLTEGK